MRRVTKSDPISLEELRRLAPGRFRDMIKGVVDLRRRLLVIDADMHADQEASLLADASDRRDLWGINSGTSTRTRWRPGREPAGPSAGAARAYFSRSSRPFRRMRFL